MVKSNAKNMARKPGEENKSSKVVGGIQYEEQQKNSCKKTGRNFTNPSQPDFAHYFWLYTWLCQPFQTSSTPYHPCQQ